MCMVAPRGSTMSVTSLEMPVASASSMLVGMVAAEEQVPREVMAGRAMLEHGLDAALAAAEPGEQGKAVKK